MGLTWHWMLRRSAVECITTIHLFVGRDAHAYDPFGCYRVPGLLSCLTHSCLKFKEGIEFLLLAERLPPRGSRGTATNINGGGQNKKKKSESLKSVGGEVLSNQGAQQSDRTEEKVTLNDGESVADNVNQPLQEEGRMRRGFRRVLTSVSGMDGLLPAPLLSAIFPLLN